MAWMHLGVVMVAVVVGNVPPQMACWHLDTCLGLWQRSCRGLVMVLPV